MQVFCDRYGKERCTAQMCSGISDNLIIPIMTVIEFLNANTSDVLYGLFDELLRPSIYQGMLDSVVPC